MYGLVETFLSSRKTQKQFCLENTISLSTFQFWLSLYRREKPPVPIKPTKTERSFIPIHFASKDPSSGPECACSVEYPNGVRIRFNSRPDLDILLGLIQVKAA